MKNNIAIILIAGAIAAPALTQAQGRQQNGQGQHQRGHGAPNSLSNQQGGHSGSANRGTLRRPYNNENNGNSGNSDRTGQGRGTQQSGNNGHTSRGSGMSRTEPSGQSGRGNNGQSGRGNNGQSGRGNSGQSGRGNGQQEHGNNGQTGGQRGQQQGQGNSLREQLNLSEEQLSKLRAAHKEWKALAKSIHQNQELSQEEKKAKYKAAFKKYDAKVREILTEEQYAKLVQIRRNASRPNQSNGNNSSGENGHSRAQHRRELLELLALTEEQLTKLRAIHQYATKKIKTIIANEELTRDEKKKKIKAAKKQAHNRRMEVLTEEQKTKLRQWIARHRAQHQQQSGSGTTSGQPRGRTQGQTNGQNPQHQQGGTHGNTSEHQTQTQTQQSDKVILYTIPSCGYCKKAAKLLKDNGIAFAEKNIQSDHAARAELAKKTREAGIQWRGGVPVTDARGDIIVGYNRTALSRIE